MFLTFLLVHQCRPLHLKCFELLVQFLEPCEFFPSVLFSLIPEGKEKKTVTDEGSQLLDAHKGRAVYFQSAITSISSSQWPVMSSSNIFSEDKQNVSASPPAVTELQEFQHSSDANNKGASQSKFKRRGKKM